MTDGKCVSPHYREGQMSATTNATLLICCMNLLLCKIFKFFFYKNQFVIYFYNEGFRDILMYLFEYKNNNE